jgi:hypothetical protein
MSDWPQNSIDIGITASGAEKLGADRWHNCNRHGRERLPGAPEGEIRSPCELPRLVGA